MLWVYYGILILVQLLGLFLNILGLPGLWLMVGAMAAYAWATGFRVYVGWEALLAVLLLALVAEGVEFLAGAAGSKAAGGSKRGMVGAIVGGIVGGIIGTPFFPVVGTVVGACLGSFIGAFGIELLVGRTTGESTRIGIGAAKGRFVGIVSKSAIGLIMLLVSAVTALPVGTPPPPAPAPAATPQQTAAHRPPPAFPRALHLVG